MRRVRTLFGSRAVMAGVSCVALGLILAQVAHRNQGEPALYGVNNKLIFRGTPGWSHTLYDAAVVAAWLLILIGLVWVIAGLVRYWTVQRAATR
jgi:MFS superfamily sulfate permease-like transporter